MSGGPHGGKSGVVIQQAGGTESLGFPLPGSPFLSHERHHPLSAERQCSSFLLQRETLAPVLSWTDVHIKCIT